MAIISVNPGVCRLESHHEEELKYQWFRSRYEIIVVFVLL